jgi:hypothetical protein
MHRIALSLIVPLALVAGVTVPVAAEASPRHRGYGFTRDSGSPAQVYVGFSGLGTGVVAQSGGVEYMESGGGGSIWGGLRLGPLVALELSYTGSLHNPAEACEIGRYYDLCSANYLVLDMLSADVKLHFPTRTNIDPYLQGGLIYGWVGREGFAPDSKGAGFELGGGFDVWLNPWWTLGVRGLYRGLKLSDYEASSGTGMFLSVVTGEIGLGVHF